MRDDLEYQGVFPDFFPCECQYTRWYTGESHFMANCMRVMQCTVHRLHSPISGVDPQQNELVYWHSQEDKSGERAGLSCHSKLPLIEMRRSGKCSLKSVTYLIWHSKQCEKKIQRCSNVIKKIKGRRYIYLVFLIFEISKLCCRTLYFLMETAWHLFLLGKLTRVRCLFDGRTKAQIL